MPSPARCRDAAAALVTLLGAAVLAVTGCAAAQQNTGSRVDRERDIRTRFSQNQFCPEPEVYVTGDGSNFEATGCGKSARYSCFEPTDPSNEAGFVCSDSARTPWRGQQEQRPRSLNHPEQVPPGPVRRP
ncbi:MAG: hypothetical protein JW940_18600 [Polyangiaceae bacterium]|nr:hypothetical protein [Polyangiaceae bacterium]